MPEIIPAILPEDFDDVREHIALVRGIAPMVQIDIVDGDFAPDATWPYKNDPGGIFERMAAEEEAMPFWQEVDFEVDMMVHRAEDVTKSWLNAGARRLVLHVESDTDIEKVIADVRDISSDKDSILYTEIGIALNTSTDNDGVAQYFDASREHTADFIQCMGIAEIGHQGEPFDERVIDKIVDFRQRYPGVIISVDGGVDVDTAPELAEAGAKRLVSGSGVFESGDVAQAIEDLKTVTSSDTGDGEPEEEQ